MLGTGRCSLPAMLETPNALSVPNRGGLRQAFVKKELMTWPNVRNYTLTRNHRQSASVSRRFSSFSARFLKTSRMVLNGPVNRRLTIPLRLTSSR